VSYNNIQRYPTHMPGLQLKSCLLYMDVPTLAKLILTQLRKQLQLLLPHNGQCWEYKCRVDMMPAVTALVAACSTTDTAAAEN